MTSRERTSRWISQLHPRNIGAIYAWIGIIIVFWAISPQYFPRLTTLEEVLNQNAVVGLVALAIVLPLAAGVFDLSVGITAGMAGMVTAWVLANVTTNMFFAILAGLAVALAAGAVNSFVVVVLGVDSFIGTLATSSIFTAITISVSADQPISQNVDGAFANNIALRNLHGVTIPVLYVLIVMLTVAFVLEKTVFGRNIYAIGFEREVARLSGVKVATSQSVSLMCCALIAGAAGITEAGVLGAGSPDVGSSFLIPAYAAAFLGATQFRRGRFNPWGTVVAVLLLGTGNVGLLISGAQIWTQDAFEGVVLIVAVGFTSHRSGSLGRVVDRLRQRTKRDSEPPPDLDSGEVGDLGPSSSDGGLSPPISLGALGESQA
jgi:ribose transport system permease protein